MQVLPPLQSPIWERQPDETDEEFRAFRAFLCEGAHYGDWARAAQVAGLEPAFLQALAQRWAWEARLGEFRRSVAEGSSVALKGLAESITELHGLILSNAIIVEKARASELEKLLKVVTSTPVNVMSTAEIARLGRTSAAIARLLHDISEKPPDEKGKGYDFSQLPPGELEAFRRITELARKPG